MTEEARHDEDPSQTAAMWIVRLGAGPLALDEQRRLDGWIAAHPFHASAYEDARQTWAAMAKLADDPGPLARYRVPADRATRRRAERRWIASGAMAASLVLALAVGSAWVGNPWILLRADHRTGIAETETIALDDGSRVDLAPSSAIAVDYDKNRRRIRLLSGKAYFIVTPKERAGGRPFTVSADGGSATALGTRFLVDRLPDGVDVTVIEHKVAVSGRDEAPDADRAVLSPGEHVRYDETGVLGRVSAANPDFALAWRGGQLVFDREPFADVVAELGRYRTGRILVGGALSRRRISGVFDPRDTDGALTALAREVGARRLSLPLLTVLY